MNNKAILNFDSDSEPSLGFVFNIHRDDPSLKNAIRNLLAYYYSGAQLTNSLDLELSNRRKDVDVINIDTRFNYPDMGEQDYSIFRVFTKPQQLILDIGANWGYSVIDIWALGAACKIFSFEPVIHYDPLLKRISDLKPELYSYKIIALSDQKTSLKFMTPIVNDLPIFALSSATSNPNLEVMTGNILNHIYKYMPDDEFINLKLHEFVSPVDTLDNQIEDIFLHSEWNELAAIKIDVEGLEFSVLKGGVNVLKKYTPMIMIEGGNRWEGVSEFMETLGYIFLERNTDKLDLSFKTGSQVNGFFVHVSKISHYKSLGILN